jgi:hypothetical protein
MINHIISNESIESAIVAAALALNLWCPSPSDASHSKGPTAGAGSRIGEGAWRMVKKLESCCYFINSQMD